MARKQNRGGTMTPKIIKCDKEGRIIPPDETKIQMKKGEMAFLLVHKLSELGFTDYFMADPERLRFDVEINIRRIKQ